MIDDIVKKATDEIFNKIRDIELDIIQKVTKLFNPDEIENLVSENLNSYKSQTLILKKDKTWLCEFLYKVVPEPIKDNKFVLKLEYDVIYNEEIFK